jgi:hypothetical protein
MTSCTRAKHVRNSTIALYSIFASINKLNVNVSTNTKCMELKNVEILGYEDQYQVVFHREKVVPKCDD